MVLYLLLAAGAYILGYEIYESQKAPVGALGFLIIPAGANVLEPDGTIQTLSIDTPSSTLPPGSFVGSTNADYVIEKDGSVSRYNAGKLVQGVVTLAAGTTVMAPDGSSQTLATDTSSASLKTGSIVFFSEGELYVVAPDGTLHQASAA